MRYLKTKLDKAYWFQEGPGVRKWQFRDEGIKLLNVANILKSGQLDLNKTDKYLCNDEVNEKYSHFLADKGDLVIASSGISIDEDGLLRTRGAFIEEQHLPICMNTSTIRFKARDSISDLRFLKHWINSYEFRVQISREVTGIAQKNFGPSHLKKIIINLPPLEEQKRIARILDTADEIRAKRRQGIEELDRLAQSVFLDMFGDPVTNPKGWQVSKITDVVSGKYGIKAGPFGSSLKKEDYVENGYRVYGQEQVIAGSFDVGDYYIDEIKFQKLKNCAVNAGDILMSLVGSFGKVLIVPNGIEKGIINPRLVKITPDLGLIDSTFLATILENEATQKTLKSMAHGGTMGIINASIIKQLSIILPPILLQKKFASIIQSIEAQKSLHQQHLTELDNLFASLQSRAFNGTL